MDELTIRQNSRYRQLDKWMVEMSASRQWLIRTFFTMSCCVLFSVPALLYAAVQPPLFQPSVPRTGDPLGRVKTADQYENNWSFETAAAINEGEEINANFVCPNAITGCSNGDQDFYRFEAKRGTCYTVATDNLSMGVDTNIILFGPDRVAFAGNDDRAPGDARSLVQFCVPPAGNRSITILVGPVTQLVPPLEARTYTLRVSRFTPLTPTSRPTRTPLSVFAIVSPTVQLSVPQRSGDATVETAQSGPTPTVQQAVATVTTELLPSPAPQETTLRVQEVAPLIPTQSAPTSVPAQVVRLPLRICWDANRTESCDADEGVQGLVVALLNERTGAVLARGRTDQRGSLLMTVLALPTDRLEIVVPYLNLSKPVDLTTDTLDPIVLSATSTQRPALLP